MARAVYAPAGFVGSTDSTITLSVPNAAHRAKCEQQRSVVEAALATFAGSPVTVELVDGDGGDGGGSDGSTSTAPPVGSSAPGDPNSPVEDRPDTSGAGTDSSSPRERGLATAVAMGAAGQTAEDDPPVSAIDLPDDDDVDLDDLIDAPPDSVKSPIDRLAEAFPGSELIDEAG